MPATTERDGDRDGPRVIGEPIHGIRPVPEFEDADVVTWLCPQCGERGTLVSEKPRQPRCTNIECRVRRFTVFGGEPDGA